MQNTYKKFDERYKFHLSIRLRRVMADSTIIHFASLLRLNLINNFPNTNSKVKIKCNRLIKLNISYTVIIDTKISDMEYMTE